MPTAPDDLANEALDLIGYAGGPVNLGDGSHASNVATRAYGPTIRLALRSAPWNFARKAAQLALLQDATGQTPGVGTNTPTPFVYEYLFPADAVKIRFVPWLWPGVNGSTTGAPAGNIAVPNLPNFPVPTNPAIFPKPGLARFQVAFDDTLPNVIGDPTAPGAPAAPDWADAEGEGPLSNRVILCDVPPPCTAVYTALTLIPETWDAIFREMMIHLLAAKFAVPILTRQGVKHGEAMLIAREQSAHARDRAMEARAADNNEAMPTVDHTPDWIRARRWGGYRGGSWGYGPIAAGYGDGLYSGWDAVSFPGLAAF